DDRDAPGQEREAAAARPPASRRREADPGAGTPWAEGPRAVRPRPDDPQSDHRARGGHGRRAVRPAAGTEYQRRSGGRRARPPGRRGDPGGHHLRRHGASRRAARRGDGPPAGRRRGGAADEEDGRDAAPGGPAGRAAAGAAAAGREAVLERRDPHARPDADAGAHHHDQPGHLGRRGHPGERSLPRNVEPEDPPCPDPEEGPGHGPGLLHGPVQGHPGREDRHSYHLTGARRLAMPAPTRPMRPRSPRNLTPTVALLLALAPGCARRPDDPARAFVLQTLKKGDRLILLPVLDAPP